MISSLAVQRPYQLTDEPHLYLKIGKKAGETQMLEEHFQPMPNYVYRMIRNVPTESELHHSSDLYIDRYQIDPITEFPLEEVIVKRLSNLYGLTNMPAFIDLQKQPTHLDSFSTQPHCIKQLGLFDTLYYKKVFITQSWSQKGKYILTANIDGRFQTISVDDRIPVYKNTLEPVWRLSYDRPWEIILIKAWAKIKGGYDRVAHSKAFEFVQTFSNSTWKYYNIQLEAEVFLKRYSQDSRFRNGKIILKTKQEEPNSNTLTINGFAPAAACYQLIGLFQETDQKKQPKYILAIRTTDQAKWAGEISFFSKSSQKYFQPHMNLEHDFFMTHTQFLSVFSSAYITSNRIEDYYTGHKLLDISKNYKKAIHFEFYLPSDGFFDFNIKQFSQNKIEAGEESKIEHSTIEPHQHNPPHSQRYLKTRYILVKDTGQQGAVQSHIRTSIVGSQAREYTAPRYITYQIEYLKGYNKGDAHFVKLEKGKYILRFKSENINIHAKYIINWISSHKLEFEVARITAPQTIQLLHDSMISIMHKFPHFNFSKEQKTQMITIANAFEEIGYGFIAIQCAHQCSRSIILQIDPEKLRLEGYRLKGRYKKLSDTNQKFCIKVEKEEYAVVVFKRSTQATNYVWPSQAFNIYRKQIKKSMVQGEQSAKASMVGESRMFQKQPK